MLEIRLSCWGMIQKWNKCVCAKGIFPKLFETSAFASKDKNLCWKKSTPPIAERPIKGVPHPSTQNKKIQVIFLFYKNWDFGCFLYKIYRRFRIWKIFCRRYSEICSKLSLFHSSHGMGIVSLQHLIGKFIGNHNIWGHKMSLYPIFERIYLSYESFPEALDKLVGKSRV